MFWSKKKDCHLWQNLQGSLKYRQESTSTLINNVASWTGFFGLVSFNKIWSGIWLRKHFMARQALSVSAVRKLASESQDTLIYMCIYLSVLRIWVRNFLIAGNQANIWYQNIMSSILKKQTVVSVCWQISHCPVSWSLSPTCNVMLEGQNLTYRVIKNSTVAFIVNRKLNISLSNI